MALWGLAYLLAAWETPEAAARILKLNLIGSTSLPALFVEWVAVLLLVAGAGTWVTRRIPTGWENPALVAGTLIAVMVVGEGAARLYAALAPQTSSLPTYASKRWEQRYVSRNSLGYRDREHPLEAPVGVQRMLVVGDSFTWGTGVKETSNRFSEQLATHISTTRGEKWVSINAGLPDTHTLHHIDALPRMGKFNPDLILLVYVFNDIDYLGRTTDRAAVFRNDSLIHRLDPIRALYMNSYLFQEIYTRWRWVRHSLQAAERSPYDDPVLLSRHLADLQHFVTVARELAPEVCIVPYDLQVADNEAGKTRYRRFVAEVVAAGLPVCGLLETFAGLKRADLQVSALDGHPNAEANRLAAVAVAACLFGSRAAGMSLAPHWLPVLPARHTVAEMSRHLPSPPLDEATRPRRRY